MSIDSITSENYFEAAQALHWYCVDNHSGQSSELYAIQCELGYTPSLSENGVSEDNASAFFYEALEVGSIEAPKLLELIQEVMAEND
jgi:hypothetical protein